MRRPAKQTPTGYPTGSAARSKTIGLEIVPVTPLAQNCSVVWCTKTRLAAVIDPGGELTKIERVLLANDLSLDKILITHAHLDHAGATHALASKANTPIVGPHPDDQFLIDSLAAQGRQYGIPAEPFVPTQWLKQGDQVSLGNLTFKVLHCPGHTPGHVVFVEEQAQLAFVGDVLFRGSIGRSDFPRGNHQQLLKSIRQRLFAQPGATRFVPGHGPMSTFAEERRSNPYVADQLF